MPISRTPDALLQRVLRGSAAQLLGGGLKGLEKEKSAGHAARPHCTDPASAGTGRGAHPSTHHHRLFRSPDRTGYAASGNAGRHVGISRRHSQLRVPAPARGNALGHEHALQTRGRNRNSHRELRPLQHRHDEARVSPRPELALRPHHADDFRRTFQLFLSAGAVAGAAGTARRPPSVARLHGRWLLRHAAQFPAAWLLVPFFSVRRRRFARASSMAAIRVSRN